MENKRSLSLVESRHRHFYGGLQSVAQLSPFDRDMAICAVLESGPQFAGSALTDHQVVVPLQCFDDFLLCLHIHRNEMKTQAGTEAKAKNLPAVTLRQEVWRPSKPTMPTGAPGNLLSKQPTTGGGAGLIVLAVCVRFPDAV